MSPTKNEENAIFRSPSDLGKPLWQPNDKFSNPKIAYKNNFTVICDEMFEMNETIRVTYFTPD